MESTRVLIIEANPKAGATFRNQLRGLGFDAEEAGTLAQALVLDASFRPTVVLLDLNAPGCEGSRLVEGLRAQGSRASVVLVGSGGEGETALQALAAGADRFLVRPLDPGPLQAAIRGAGQGSALAVEIAGLRDRLRGRLALVGAGPELVSVFELVRRVAPTKATVLIHGEPGAGKHHLAQLVHELSPRRERPFVDVNCAAASESQVERELFGHEREAFEDSDRRRLGRIEEARGGTLYVQEVGRLAPALQVRLLRVLQEGVFERRGGRGLRSADVRVVAGSSRDLADEVRHGRFRDDLYYRLNVVAAALPPLRDRKADIPALVAHLLADRARATSAAPLQVTPGVLSAFFTYPWPGNVGELEAVLGAAAAHATGAELHLEDLPPVLTGGQPEGGVASGLIPGATLFEIEREAILRTLEQAGGSTARAAEVLGVSVRKIQYRLKEYRAGPAGQPHPAAAVSFGGETHGR